LPLLLIGLACVFPLAMYCLYMAMLHQRSRATMIAGPWDFVAVLAALSGFLLVGGTTILFALHTSVRDSWLLAGSVYNLRDIHSRIGALTFVIWGLYFLALVGGAIFFISRRRPVTLVYHVTPDEVEPMLDAAISRLGIPLTRRGARWLIGIVDRPLAKSTSSDREFSGRGIVEVDGSEASRVTTLRWQYATRTLRADVEAELTRELAAFQPPASPATLWFMTIAGSLFVLMIFFLATFLLIALR